MAWQNLGSAGIAGKHPLYLQRGMRIYSRSIVTRQSRAFGVQSFAGLPRHRRPGYSPKPSSPVQLLKPYFHTAATQNLASVISRSNSTSSTGSASVTKSEDVNLEPYGKFPNFWLRENCQCPDCIHPITRQRMLDTFSLPEDIQAEAVDTGSEKFIVKWSDGHTGVYPRSWLSDHQLPSVLKPTQDVLNFREFRFVPDNKSYPISEYRDVVESTQGLADWLKNIVIYGYCMVRGVPPEPEATHRLLERIAFVRPTHYGGFWDFTSDLTYKDTAYTSEFLGVHTDNTYFSDPARLQLFHLLSHTGGEGGETLLADGFRAAEVMLSENEANVKTLIDIPQPWHSSGNDDVCIQPYQLFPVFERDGLTGILQRIRWNNYDRAVKVDWEPHVAAQWYRAARHWNEILGRKDILIQMQLEPGTALIFDNWRILHGRTAFFGKRRMCGGYINNDDFVSRYRLLNDGREKTLNSIGTFASRLTC